MDTQKLTIKSKWRPLKIGIIGLVLFVGAAAGGAAIAVLNAPAPVVIPKAIIEKTLFTLYVPDTLPAGYFMPGGAVSTEESTTLFYITNGPKRIIFSEQAKPKDFDFANFYERQMVQPKNLERVPYPSVLGMTREADKLLSVVTPDTWVLVSVVGDVSEDELRFVARHLRKY